MISVDVLILGNTGTFEICAVDCNIDVALLLIRSCLIILCSGSALQGQGKQTNICNAK